MLWTSEAQMRRTAVRHPLSGSETRSILARVDTLHFL
jgi:hypothetical protein